MSVVDSSYGYPLKPEEKASMPLAGGLLQNGYQCGMLWGAALAAGAQMYRRYGAGPEAESQAVAAAQQLVESFRARNRHIDCFEITELDWKAASQRDLLTKVLKFFLKGGPIGCFRMAARYAPAAREDIDASLAQSKTITASPPVSCTARLAQTLDASEMQGVMVAGLAGGIGLSGGGCGALGAAIWFLALRGGMEEVQGMVLAPPGAEDLVERFLEASDYEFECEKIVGRRFENVDDHAAFVRQGGCAKILKALANP